MAGTSLSTLVDSVIVYEAIIYGLDIPSTTEFELKYLVYGEPSQFSWITQRHLTARKTSYFNDGRRKWQPLVKDSQIPKTNKIRINARLNPEGSVTVKLPASN